MSLQCLAGEITTAFNYIENNLEHKIVLEDIAAACNLSKFHMHRILSAIANRPLMEYIRARKLAESLNMLRVRRNRIIDIASRYAFEFEQSYIRAFRREFGISPGAFRKKPMKLNFTQKICPLHYTSVSDGVLVAPVFRYMPGFMLEGKKQTYVGDRNRWDDIDDSADFCISPDECNIPGCINPERYFIFTRIEKNEIGDSYQIQAYQVKADVDILPGMQNEPVAEANYAIFKYIGLFELENLKLSHVEELWEFILHIWLPRSQYNTSGNYRFAMIDSSKAGDAYCEVGLYVPVEGANMPNVTFIKNSGISYGGNRIIT